MPLQKRLKPEIIDKIKTDPHLYCAVTIAANTTPLTLPGMLYKGSFKLTTYNVLQAISEYLNRPVSDLVE
jgi:hypothetical protein